MWIVFIEGLQLIINIDVNIYHRSAYNDLKQKKTQQILTLEKMEPTNVWDIGLIKYLNN